MGRSVQVDVGSSAGRLLRQSVERTDHLAGFLLTPQVGEPSLATLESDDEFMRFGRLPGGGFLGDPTYAAREPYGWFTAGESNSAGLMLFDLSSPPTYDYGGP